MTRTRSAESAHGRERRHRRWHELTSEELGARIEGDPVVLLPLAAIEQHGPHLPLSTDAAIGEGIVDAAIEAVDEDVPLLVLPLQPFGASPEHESFPGTLSLDPATLESFLFDTGASLSRAGVQRLVVANSHGGNRAVLDTAGLRLRRTFDMLVVKASYFRFRPPAEVDLPDGEWAHGLHGGAVETAMMLHLRPHLVRTDRIRTFPSLGQELKDELTHLGPEGAASFSWSADDLGEAGAVGDATLADEAMGRELVAHYGRCLAEVLRDAHRFPVDRLAQGDGRRG